MTVYELQRKHEQFHPGSHFFDRDTLKFFGETYSTMNVLKGTVKMKDISGQEHEAYILSSLQRKAPGGPQRTWHYFDAMTYEHIIK